MSRQYWGLPVDSYVITYKGKKYVWLTRQRVKTRTATH